MSSFDPSNGKAEFSAAFFRSQGSRAALEAMHWVVETAFMHQGLFKLIAAGLMLFGLVSLVMARFRRIADDDVVARVKSGVPHRH